MQPFNHITQRAQRMTIITRSFTREVARKARGITGNPNAGTTASELDYCAEYLSHSAPSTPLHLAIIDCACSMVEQLRPSELQ